MLPAADVGRLPERRRCACVAEKNPSTMKEENIRMPARERAGERGETALFGPPPFHGFGGARIRRAVVFNRLK